MIRTAAIVAAACAAHASASTVNFSAYSNNSGNTAGIDVSASLSATANTFTVTLSNQSIQGTMTSFYLESGAGVAGLGAATIQNGPGVSFAPGANPSVPKGDIQNLAGGSWSGNFFSMGRTGGVQDGMDPGETVTVVFAHDGTFSLNSLLSAIANDEIRLAMHYQRWGTNGNASEWLIGGLNDPLVVIPLPPAAWAGLGTLGLIAGVRAARRNGRR